MKKMAKRIGILLLALLLSGCASDAQESQQEGEYRIYYAVDLSEESGMALKAGAAAVGYELWTPEQTVLNNPVKLARALTEQLLAGPRTEALCTPAPEDVQLRRCMLSDGVLWLDLSERYSELSGINLTVANCCLVLTLTQVAGVESVRVTVEGRELPYFSDKDLRPQDIALDIP